MINIRRTRPCDPGVNYPTYLLKKGIYINSKNRDGETSLHYAIKYGNNEIIKILLANGADINLENCYGVTPKMLLDIYEINSLKK